MAAYLVCLTSGGGVPLFTRKTLDFKSLPFPVVGSLNGVHMFAKSHGATLLNTLSKDAKVVWKEFNDSIILIVAVTNDVGNEIHLSRLLDAVFDSMVLLIGLDSIVGVTNVERLKRDLKCCYVMIDALLMQLTRPLHNVSLIGDVARCIDCIACPESNALQSYLDSFVEIADSTYGCLLVHGKVAVATRDWWALNARESSLLCLFLASAPKATCRDVPVFLPVGNPTVAHRLLVFQLMQEINVCVLCGPKPSLTHLGKEVGKCWKDASELLKSALDCHPRNVPSSVQLDKNILGFILVSNKDNKSLCSVCPHGLKSNSLDNSSDHRLEVLRSFYKLTTGHVFYDCTENDEAPGDANLTNKQVLRHSCKETYLCTATHKLYAIRTDQDQIFIMFTSAMPMFALRSVSNKTLQRLTTSRIVRI